MALVLKDRVRVTSNSSGTGAFSLSGALMGYQDFSVIGNGNTTYYCITDASYGAWEVGIGTYNSSSLSRDTVLSSSNAGSLVDFAIGTLKDVFCTYPAERTVAPTAPVTYTASFTLGVDDTWVINNKTPVPSGPTTFDPLTSSPTVTLSNGDLTAQGTDMVGTPYWYGAISTTSYTTGKLYFEVTQDVYDYYALMAGLATGPTEIGGPNTNYIGFNANGWAFEFSELGVSYLYHNASATSVGAPLTANGDIVGIAVDFDAGLMWFSKNGAWVDVGNGAGDPAAGLNPSYTFTPNTELYAAVCFRLDQSIATVNFGASAFAYGAPFGFTGWGNANVPTTVTLPAASSYPGRTVTFQNYQAQTLVSATNNVVPLGGGVPGVAILPATAGNWATLVSDGTNWIIMTTGVNNALLLE